MEIKLEMSNNPHRLFDVLLFNDNGTVAYPNIQEGEAEGFIGYIYTKEYPKYGMRLLTSIKEYDALEGKFTGTIVKDISREFKWEWLKNQYPEILRMNYTNYGDTDYARPEDMDLEQKVHFITACYVEGYYADIYNTVGNHLSNYSEEQINAQFEKLLNESVDKTLNR